MHERYRQTDRRQTDGRHHIANVNPYRSVSFVSYRIVRRCIVTVGYTMDTVYFGWIDNPVEIDPDVQFPQFKLIESLLYDCSMNYTAGTTRYFTYVVSIRCCILLLSSCRTYDRYVSSSIDFYRTFLNYRVAPQHGDHTVTTD